MGVLELEVVGVRVEMPSRTPIVLLREKASGLMSYFTNFHNPANTAQYPNQGKWRAEATRVEVALHNQLAASGIPRFMTGDMNERETYFCPMTSLAPMKSAAGGSMDNAPCTPPADMRIDQIFGSRFVSFANYTVAQGKLIRKTTDHPLVYADVSVPTRRRP